MHTPWPDPGAPTRAIDPRFIHAAFLARAAEAPDRIGIRQGGVEYSYSEIEGRSRGLANLLLSRGLRPGDQVAILAERKPALIWSVLAALRAGMPFMMLDAADPDARHRSLLAAGAPRLMISDGGSRGRALGADAGLPVCDAARAPQGGDELPGALDPGDLAYILFTSGSDGHPKAVGSSHTPLTHFLDWQRTTFELSSRDRFSLLSGLSHDPMLRDVFAPLSVGAAIEIPSSAQMIAPGGVRAWLAQTACTVAHATPSMGELMVAGAKDETLADLRLVFWGGELLRPRLVQDMERLAPGVESVNFYGATETPQAAAFFRCNSAEMGTRTPIGAGTPGFDLRVLNPDGSESGVGEHGEIVVRSSYLSLGYLVAGSAAQGWPDTGHNSGERAYATGDIGYRSEAGPLVLVGRRDDQIKVRGHRVDLEEIAAALRLDPRIEDVLVLVLPGDGRPQVAAFVQAPLDLDEGALRAALNARLPSYMQPDRMKVLTAFPRLANGKPDRLGLQALAETPVTTQAVTATEAALIACWAPLFGRRALSPTDSFASLNGDSLSYVHAYLGAQEVIGDPPEGWTNLTIAALASQAPQATTIPKRDWGLGAIETPILLRAAAIVGIVAIHAHVLPADGGATNALFLVSGFLLARLQLEPAYRTGRLEPILRYIAVVAVPTLLFGGAMYGLRVVQGHHPSLSLLLMTEDFVDWGRFAGPPWDYHEPELWYLHALIHMAAFLAVGLALSRYFPRLPVARFLLGVFVLGCVARFILPALWLGPGLGAAARSFSLFSVLPTTHLATLALGGLFAVSPPRAWGTWALGLGYALLSGLLFGPAMGVVLLVSMLILGIRRVPVLRVLRPPIFVIANASLFIYLANLKVMRVAAVLPGGAASPLVPIIATVLVGVGLAAVWQRVQRLALRGRRAWA